MKPPNDLSDEYLEKELDNIFKMFTSPFPGTFYVEVLDVKLMKEALLSHCKMLIERARREKI